MGLTQPIPSDAPTDATSEALDYASVKLTPPLVLTIALMFIIASDGNVDASESSQIQSVIGQNDALVRFASSYVRTVSLPVFLSRAAQGLSAQDKMCILSNVCDAMLADGVVREVEQKTFELLRTALGVSHKAFARDQTTLTLKNDASVLGPYRPNITSTSMTPHLALAASVLYMMSADGSIDKHEIGRLETLVVQFGGLQRIAVAYVKKTKRERFFQEAAHALNEAQKQFILLNVYDTMTADGVVAVTEDKIFQALLEAFGIKASDFTAHADALERKNLKPFDMRKVNVGQLFESALSGEETVHAVDGQAGNATVGQIVARTMQENVVNVEQDIGASQNVIQIQSNALGQVNLQQIDAANDPTHRERVASEAAQINRQTIDSASAETHREAVETTGLVDTRATIDTQPLGVNRQSLGAFEVRIENLAEDIEVLHDQLITFEQQNQKWLNMGRVFRAQEERNQQVIAGDEAQASRLQIPEQAQSPNRQTLSADAPSVNRQKFWAALDARVQLFFGAQKKSSTYGLASTEGLTNPQGLTNTEDHFVADDAVTTTAPATTTATTPATTTTTQKAPAQTSATLARSTHIDTHKRVASGFAYVPRILAFAVAGAAKIGIKEWMIAFSFTLCVSNLGATKDPHHREARGVLVKLEASPHAHDAATIELTGP